VRLERERELTKYFLLAAVVSCVAQLAWFGSKGFSEIDYDGLSYVGIARHLRDGRFYVAISAFRSPLISWLIAAGSLLDRNFLEVGKFVHIGSFLASAVLLYVLTEELWHSKLVASIACLWFVLARGFASTAVTLIIPDFLLTVFVLTYFLILLRCFRGNRSGDWILLGLVHGVAYLAKAFALPWLALASVVAVVISFRRDAKQGLQRLALASFLPIVIAGTWASVLHSKYDVFTMGSQFKANFIHYNFKDYSKKEVTYSVLNNAVLGPGIADPSFVKSDEYQVNDPVPPHSPVWNVRFSIRQVLALMILAEFRNLPGIVKELTILLTPGGILGFFFVLVTMMRARDWGAEFRFTAVVAVSAVSLILAYGMLVFLTTYAFPLVPLIIAVTSRFLVVGDVRFSGHALWRRVCIALVLGGLVASFTYRSSPFRTLDRNFQMSCYDAARKLEPYAGPRVVTIGSGPYPEHGVGWEAGYRTAYFANRQIVAQAGDLPSEIAPLMSDIKKASADEVLLWGRQTDPRFQLISWNVAQKYRVQVPIVDPSFGQVGMVFALRNSGN
jgi:hypothetical protein